MKKLEQSFLKVGLTLGLAMALPSLITGSMGVYLIRQVLQRENRIHLQNLAGLMSRTLAVSIKNELEILVGHLSEAGHGVLFNSGNQMISIATDFEILDISLWEKRGSGAKRVLTAANQKNLASNQKWLEEVMRNEEAERNMILPAFQGRAVIVLPPVSLSKKDIVLVAVPITTSGSMASATAAENPSRVVVSHVEFSRFHQMFKAQEMTKAEGAVKKEGDKIISGVLVDRSGDALVDEDQMGGGKRLAFAENPLFQMMHSSKTQFGQSRFMNRLDASNHLSLLSLRNSLSHYAGGYAQVGVGDLAVLAMAMEPEEAKSYSYLKKKLFVFVAAFASLFFGIGYLAKGVISPSLARHAPPMPKKNSQEPSPLLESWEDPVPAGEVPSASPAMTFSRWFVNNGSQTAGPLTPEEIASRLFAQEIDFESECWVEGSSKKVPIQEARIFVRSEDPQADLWAYDGKVLLGPLNLEFLKMALIHGVISEVAYVCEKSTVQGWKLLSKILPELEMEVKNKQKAIHENALRDSIAPPELKESTILKEDAAIQSLQEFRDPAPKDPVPVEKDQQKKAA